MNEVKVYGRIGVDVKSQDFTDQLNAYKGLPVTVSINSRGGDLIDALSMFNAMQAHDAEVTAHVKGSALSAASFLLLAAKKAVADEASLIMIHPPKVSFTGGVKELQSAMDLVSSSTKMVRELYAKKTGKTEAEIDEYLQKDTWMSAKVAMERGFIDEVISASSKEKVVLDMSDTQRGEVPDEYSELVTLEDESMSKLEALLGVAKELKLSFDENDATEDSVKKLIMEAFDKRESEKGLEKKVERKPIPKPYLTMARENRANKIDNLVKEGKITNAVGKDLKDQYCSDANLTMILSEEGDDNFDLTMSALDKNESVVSLGEKSPLQKVILEADKNPLLADAERRAKSFSNSRR